MKNILIILGTGREGRESEQVFSEMVNIVKERSTKIKTVDVRDFAHDYTEGLSSEKTKEWNDLITVATHFIVVTPEYNHGYPGELKMLIDAGAVPNYSGKKWLFCGVSSGTVGGARGIEGLKLVVNALEGFVDPKNVYVGPVSEFESQKEDFRKRVNIALDRFLK
ncbi:NAD(P)H-dependent oxidoreductase [Candidatus Nomurabacteria bacterium]|nr:NAD(P)H-dependent oxidoreductase [Candidatus Nomurabacteria bacterium]USN94918.1 MAG: NAD(P)H-dependent oxidoreductase [Candidatus Nomurabacteria bacterium]